MKVVDTYRARVHGRWRRIVVVDDVSNVEGVSNVWALPCRVRAPDGRTWTVLEVEKLALDNQTGLCFEEQTMLPAVGEDLEIVTT